MKRFLTIIICISILLQANSAAVVCANFYMNRDFIAKNLCENRNKPEMKCCGKCFLKKKLAKVGGEQAPSNRNSKAETNVVLFCDKAEFIVVYHPAVTSSQDYFIRNDKAGNQVAHTVFHPPTA